MAGKTNRNLAIRPKKNSVSPVRLSQPFSQNFRNPYSLITYFFILLFICLKLAAIPLPFPVTGAKTTEFQVQGTGSIVTIPNSVQTTFSVVKTAPAIADAQNQVSSSIQNILQNIKSADVQSLVSKTVNYSVFPQYNADSTGKQILNGYSVTQDIQITASPPFKINSIIDIATQNGANQVGGISFTNDDATIKKLEEKARTDAVTNAKQKAQSLAKSAGIHLGRIVNIKETDTNTQSPNTNTSTSINSDKSQEITQNPIDGNVIKATVTLTYETF